MPASPTTTDAQLAEALARAGRDETLRDAVFEALRRAELQATDASAFRSEVRWPIMTALLREVNAHRVALHDGMVFEVGPDSRIEQALLLSATAHPDHVWEPQTTRLLVAMATEAAHAIVGGAYIGDQVLLMARAMSAGTPSGTVHAFEPMESSFRRLLRNLEINGIENVVAHRMGLWDSSTALRVEGAAALGSSSPPTQGQAQTTAEPVGKSQESGDAGDARDAEDTSELIQSTTIDDYVEAQGLSSVGLIMLDTEGGEEPALRGARRLLALPETAAPHLIFEVHRSYVDWTPGLENTSIVRLLTSNGYAVFAIRDFHDNYPMAGKPIEIIPARCVYLEGPPHGFNMLATKDPGLIERLKLRVVENVSPKLLAGKDPALHHPLDGL